MYDINFSHIRYFFSYCMYRARDKQELEVDFIIINIIYLMFVKFTCIRF